MQVAALDTFGKCLLRVPTGRSPVILSLSSMNYDKSPDPYNPYRTTVPTDTTYRKNSLTRYRLPLWVLIPALLAVALIAWQLGRSSGQSAQAGNVANKVDSVEMASNAQKGIAMTVEAVRPATMNIASSVLASGTVAAKDEANVGTRLSGVAVVQVLVEAGQYVKAGQVLAVLDDELARQDSLGAIAAMRTSEAALAKATADLTRVEPLIAIDAISREQYDAYRLAKVQAQNDVMAAKARLQSSQINHKNSQVIAPVSGIISKNNAEVGMITTGAPLFTIIKGGQLEWQASIPADQITKVRVGQRVALDSATLPISDSPDQDPPKIHAVITRISPVANASRDFTVHAAIDQGAPVVAGMYLTGELFVGSHTHRTLPSSALVVLDGRDYVYTLTATAQEGIYQARRIPVQILSRQAGNVAVDVADNVLVVRQGANFLNNEDLVKLSQIVDSRSVPDHPKTQADRQTSETP